MSARGRRRPSSLAARLSWRQLRRDRWRSALIITLIGLPVLAMTLQSILVATTASTPQREIDDTLHGTDGAVVVDGWYGAEYSANFGTNTDAEAVTVPHPWRLHSGAYFLTEADLDDPMLGGAEGAGSWWAEVREQAEQYPAVAGETGEISDTELAGALPEGVRLHPVVETSGRLELDNGMTTEATVIVADFTDPALAQRFVGVDDAAPQGSTVTVSRGYHTELERLRENAEALDREAPQQVTLAGTALQIGGTTVDRDALSASDVQLLFGEDYSYPTVFVDATGPLAETVTAQLMGRGSDTTTYYLTGDVPGDYASYLPFDDAGLAVVFRAVAEKPPSMAVELAGGALYGADLYVSILFLGTLALVETGLLAGAAFAVGARSQQRTTAMLSAVGAGPATVRGAMGLSGLWCGLIGAVSGAVLGIGLALGLWGVGRSRLLMFEPPIIPWWVILVTVIIGVVVAAAAAWIPARAVAAQDAWAAIKGGVRERRGISTPVWIAGLVLVGAGVLGLAVLTAIGVSLPTLRALHTWSPLLGVGVALAGITLIVGVLLLIPAVLYGLARLASRLPWSLRIAARDADRNRSRTVPITVAMVAAACLGGAGLSLVGYNLASYSAISAHDLQRPSGADLAVAQLSTDLEHELMEEGDRLAGIDTDAPAYEDQTITHTPAEARTALEAAARAAGLEIVQTTTYSQVFQECLGYGGRVCPETYALTPDDSVCALPVPDAPTVGERLTALERAAGERTRQVSAECAPPGGGFSYYGGTYIGPSAIAVTDVDDPTPSVLWGGDPEATAAYERGHAVVLDPTLLSAENTVTLGRFTTDLAEVPGLTLDEDAENFATLQIDVDGEQVLAMSPMTDQRGLLWEPEQTRTIPAVLAVAPAAFSDIGVVVPQDQLDDVAPLLNPSGMVVRFATEPTPEQAELFGLALEQEGLWVSAGDPGPDWIQPSLWITTGVIALLVLTAAGILAGLAMADARRDHRALDAIGAAPSARKTMAAAQMFTAMVVSLVLGTVAGVLPFAAMQLITDLTLAWIPWWQLLALTVVLPVVAAGVTWLVTPARFRTR